MSLIEIWKGERFSVLAWGDEADCQLIDYLYDLEIATRERLLSIIRSAATYGPFRNEATCSRLADADWEEIFEFNAGEDIRVAWFFEIGNQIICTHGFGGYKEYKISDEVEKARTIRSQYRKERADAKTRKQKRQSQAG